MSDMPLPTEQSDATSQVADATVAEAPATSDLPAMPRQRLPRRADLAQLLDGKPNEGEAKDQPRVADVWLERRLRVFERQMTAVEARQDQVEKSARAAAEAAQRAIDALQATVKALEDRAGAAEAKAKTAAAEVRAALNEATLRLQTVESVARAALSETAPADSAPPSPSLDSPAPDVAAEPAPAPPDTAEHTDAPAPRSYLDDVRRSVAAASAAAQDAEAARKPKGLGSITRYLLGSLAVLALFATGAGVAFSKGVSDGRHDALMHAHRARHLSLEDIARTPLDRLTARAQAGDAVAELAVGLRYLDGPDKNPAAAFRWIARAAVQGHAVAQYRLATLYAAGRGTSADPARALSWFRASAAQGNRKAMHALAIAYAQGQGTAKNPAEAARWFSRAASLGYVDSEFDLAVLYERGEGVPQSLLDAYKWYAVAGRQGDRESQLRAEALKLQLGVDDAAAAEHVAQAFHPAPYALSANIL